MFYSEKSDFNNRNSCIFVRVIILFYITFLCVVHILKHFFLRCVTKHILSLEQINGTECLTICVIEGLGKSAGSKLRST